ncbi:hypothetical protein NB620_00005 [Vibrio alginolyticus]|uniref:hypothetical protein n=1 Tax=Vibrio alginolyticus TaxID=663 RepID=UPI00215D3996|nr:hypothetical protein [Vibrio alginolyticus]MCR9998651.1 hypothetical protein [Vibrio alginolyticus]
MATRVEMIIETLKANPDKKFTARDLAKEFVLRYPEEIADKQENPRKMYIAQPAAEIEGESSERAKTVCLQISGKKSPLRGGVNTQTS